MAVRTRKRGKTWSYSFDIEPAPDGKRRMKEKGGFATKEEAFTAGASAYTDWKNGNIGLTSEKILLRDYLDKWMSVHSKNLKYHSIQAYEVSVKHINHYIGNITLQGLRPRDVDNLLQNLCNDGKALRTIRICRSVLATALSYAIYPLELITFNPCSAVKIPKRATKQVIERTVISPERLNDLLTQYPFGTPYHAPIILAYYTGLRLGELLGLTWDDVNFTTGELSVNKQLTYVVGKGYFFSTVKTDTSMRTIILDSPTLDLLRKWLSKQKEQEMSAGPQYVYTFVDEGKIIQCSKAIAESMKGIQVKPICIRPTGKIVTNASITRVLHQNGINSHSFRHTHATKLIESNASAKSVAARLGHKSTAITEDLYTHNTAEMQKQIAEITAKMHKNNVDK